MPTSNRTAKILIVSKQVYKTLPVSHWSVKKIAPPQIQAIGWANVAMLAKKYKQTDKIQPISHIYALYLPLCVVQKQLNLVQYERFMYVNVFLRGLSVVTAFPKYWKGKG